MLKQVEDEVKVKIKRLEQIAKDIERLEEVKKAEWNEIKDFRVSANRADVGYARIKNLASEIQKLNTESKKLQKYINENS